MPNECSEIALKLEDAIRADVESSVRSWQGDDCSRTRVLLCGTADRQEDANPQFPVGSLRRELGQLTATVTDMARTTDDSARCSNREKKLKEICDIIWMLELIAIAYGVEDKVPARLSDKLVGAHFDARKNPNGTPPTIDCCSRLQETWRELVRLAGEDMASRETVESKCLEHLAEIARTIGWFAANERITPTSISEEIARRTKEPKSTTRLQSLLTDAGPSLEARFVMSDKPGAYAHLLALLHEKAGVDLILSESCSKLPGRLAEATVVFTSKEARDLTRESVEELLRHDLGEDLMWVLQCRALTPTELPHAPAASVRARQTEAKTLFLLYAEQAKEVADKIKDVLRDNFNCSVDGWEHFDIRRLSGENVDKLAHSSENAVMLVTADIQEEHARPNIPWELGALREKWRDGTLIVLADRRVKMPSNVCGTWKPLITDDPCRAAVDIARHYCLSWKPQPWSSW